MIEAGLFILLLCIGVPIAFVLGLVSLSHILVTGETGFLLMIPARMFGGIDNFALLAIPAFILAGELMNAGSITDRLVSFSNMIVGRLRGGMGYANVVVSMFLAGCTGAATSEAAAVGSVMIPAMKKAGYDRDFAAGLTSTASTMGPIIPPSMPFIVYGVVGGVSIGGLFFAGVIPGLMVGIALMAVVFILAKHRKYPLCEEKYTIRQFLLVSIDALVSLSVPVIILGGIMSGICTPTEASAIAAFTALLITGVIYRELSLKAFYKILLKTGVTSAVILLIVGTANIFGWVLAANNVPQKLVEILLHITTNKYILLLMINIFLLITGTFMESLASIVIMVPILSPVIRDLGIDPLHFGVIYVLNVVIGLNTPPVGVCLYVTSAVGKISLERLVRAIIPFFLAMLTILFLVTYIPSLSTWLPRIVLG